MSSKPPGYSPVIGKDRKSEKAAGIQRLFFNFRRWNVRAAS
jgi:hypothetical protein